MKKTPPFFHLLSFLCMVLISPAHALSLGDIVTIAGGGTGYNGPATSLSLRDPSRIAIDNAGNIYITDTANHIIRKVNSATGMSQVRNLGSTIMLSHEKRQAKAG